MGILTYFKFGVVLALILGIGGLYLHDRHVTAENKLLTRQLEGYKRAVKILKEDLKTDKETEDEKARIDQLTPEQLIDEFERLRKRAGKGSNPDTEQTND